MIVAGILTPIENVLALASLGTCTSGRAARGRWSIVALTIIVRIALVPLMVKQIHSMQSLQAHMPEMKAIQQKYKGDKQSMNEELMKFYKENSINPAASCLPILVQIPVFFALYFVLKNFTKHVDTQPGDELGWLIVPNITAQDHGALVGLRAARHLRRQPARRRRTSCRRPSTRRQRILFMVAAVPLHPVRHATSRPACSSTG